MPIELLVVRSGSTDPYPNLAVERVLLEGVRPGTCVLYLWQNARTVVIGRNQSAADEVRLDELAACGGRLARRLTGGGAVYHDLGNLNFTFLAQRDDYDEDVQTDVILAAVRSLGVDAERTGRNDLVADGRKFSGHAYRRGAGGCCHHGTLMVDVDTSQMTRFLTPPAGKLAARGVASVRSRVVNLSELSPQVTVESLADALVASFEDAYGTRAAELQVDGSSAGGSLAGGSLVADSPGGGSPAGDSLAGGTLTCGFPAGDSLAGDTLTCGFPAEGFDWSLVGAYERDFASESWLFFRRHLASSPGGGEPTGGEPTDGETAGGEEPAGGEPAGEGSLTVGGPRTSSARFSWGGVTLRWRETAVPSAPSAPAAGPAASAVPGVPCITGLELDSDGLEADFLASVPAWLEGCPATAESVGHVLASHAATPLQRDVAAAIASLL